MPTTAAQESEPHPSSHLTTSAFRSAAFQRYWIGRLCAIFAIQMQSVAVGWQVYEMTQRPLDLGLVGLVQFLPALGLSLVTGHVADRYDRRYVLASCIALEGCCAFLFLLLTWQGNTDRTPIFAILFLFGVARAFEFPASFALMPNLVHPSQFANAAAWNSSTWQVGTIAGPALGGLLYAFGPRVVYGCSLALLTVGALTVSTIRYQRTVTFRKAVTWDAVVAGVHFIRQQPLVLGAISLDLFAVLLGGATALLPIYARDILVVGPWGLGLLRSAPAIGALVMALFLTQWTIKRNAGVILLTAVGVFGLATIGFALSYNLWFSMTMLAILGAADMVSVIIRRVIIQLATPDEMRGRVGAVESVFIGASNELGEFESGVTASWFGTIPAAVLGGLGTLFIVIFWSWRFPQLRNVNSMEEVGERI
ncbi:MAG: MFS transporter [Candidatus Binatia bacterium]